MTSILGTLGTLSSYLSQPTPTTAPQFTLPSGIAPSTISAGDQTAIAGAMGDIAASLKASPPMIGTDPATMQAKVGALVDQEVGNGKLTTEQAGELKQLFASNAMSASGAGATATSGATTGTGEGLGGALQSAVDFARNLRLAIKGNSPYGASGTTTAASPVGALVNGLA